MTSTFTPTTAATPGRLALVVTGRPAPQGSKRYVGHGKVIEMSKAAPVWREAIRHEVQHAGAETMAGPVSVDITFCLQRPKTGAGHKRPLPVTAPDVDKLARAVLDGLVMGGAFANDAQVCELIARKIYADDGPPGAYIIVTEITTTPSTPRTRPETPEARQ